jgi:hypothetical protein
MKLGIHGLLAITAFVAYVLCAQSREQNARPPDFQHPCDGAGCFTYFPVTAATTQQRHVS